MSPRHYSGRERGTTKNRLIMRPKFTPEYLVSQGLNPNSITAHFLSRNSLSNSFPSRFVTKFCKGNGCWEWNAGTTFQGRGSISRGSRKNGEIGAHVASWLMHVGEIPEGKWVLHKCDNGSCVNPSHLWIGDCIENVNDRVNKGRSAHKLTEKQVELIRNLSPFNTSRKIAALLKIGKTTAWSVASGKSWRHISFHDCYK